MQHEPLHSLKKMCQSLTVRREQGLRIQFLNKQYQKKTEEVHKKEATSRVSVWEITELENRNGRDLKMLSKPFLHQRYDPLNQNCS